MRSQIYVVLVLIFPIFATSQTVEIEGKLKVTKMDTINTENHLVVKQPDGTLGTRMLASLPAPPDTTRTLQSDLLLTSALCNCPSLPPAMIQSLLDNGYSILELTDFNVSLLNLYNAGISIDSLFAIGFTPIDLWAGGFPVDSLYGIMYQGGLIFYLDTLDIHTFEGLVAAPPLWDGVNDPDPSAEWGCSNTQISGTSTAVGNGQASTTSIVSSCATAGIAARLCDDLMYGGYNDWFLPSKDELDLMWNNLADPDGNNNNSGPSDPNNTGRFAAAIYWSSSEVEDATFNFDDAWSQDFGDGTQLDDLKVNVNHVRAIRAF